MKFVKNNKELGDSNAEKRNLKRFSLRFFAPLRLCERCL